MADPEQQVKWARAETALRSSLLTFGSVIDPEIAASVDEYLDHNELAIAMDALVDGVLASSADSLPGEAVEYLDVASAEMDAYRPDNWDEFESRFMRHS